MENPSKVILCGVTDATLRDPVLECTELRERQTWVSPQATVVINPNLCTVVRKQMEKSNSDQGRGCRRGFGRAHAEGAAADGMLFVTHRPEPHLTVLAIIRRLDAELRRDVDADFVRCAYAAVSTG